MTCRYCAFWVTAIVFLCSGCKIDENDRREISENLVIDYSHAMGRYSMEFPDLNKKDKTYATMERVHMEVMVDQDPGIKGGGGLIFETIKVDNNLFETTGSLGADSRVINIFPYGGIVIRPENSIFRMPLRGGVLFNYFDFEESNQTTQWWSLYFRGSVEPSLVFPIGDAMELCIFAEGNIGYGGSVVDIRGDQWHHSEETADATHTYGYEAGFRISDEHMWLGLSWISRMAQIDETSKSISRSLIAPETEYAFDGIVLTAGFRF